MVLPPGSVTATVLTGMVIVSTVASTVVTSTGTVCLLAAHCAATWSAVTSDE